MDDEDLFGAFEDEPRNPDNIKKPDDDAPAYKGDLNKAIDAGKEKNIQNKAGVFAKFSYKADPSAESKPVVVGKRFMLGIMNMVIMRTRYLERMYLLLQHRS